MLFDCCTNFLTCDKKADSAKLQMLCGVGLFTQRYSSKYCSVEQRTNILSVSFSLSFAFLYFSMYFCIPHWIRYSFPRRASNSFGRICGCFTESIYFCSSIVYAALIHFVCQICMRMADMWTHRNRKYPLSNRNKDDHIWSVPLLFDFRVTVGRIVLIELIRQKGKSHRSASFYKKKCPFLQGAIFSVNFSFILLGRVLRPNLLRWTFFMLAFYETIFTGSPCTYSIRSFL